jgi:hypothetical protein
LMAMTALDRTVSFNGQIFDVLTTKSVSPPPDVPPPLATPPEELSRVTGWAAFIAFVLSIFRRR